MMDETTHIANIVSGDKEGYRALVERYQAGLIIHSENILKDRQEAEDVAQEAFIKAYKDLASYSADKATFSTWLYRIATNLCIDTLRKYKRKVDVKDIESHLDAILPTHMEQEEIIHLRKLVNELEPPKYAEIIKAYFWEGKSYRELAELHHTTTGTIGTWMNRAKLQLKERLV